MSITLLVSVICLLVLRVSSLNITLTLNPCQHTPCTLLERDEIGDWIRISFYSSDPIDYAQLPSVLHAHHLLAIHATLPTASALNRAQRLFQPFNEQTNACLQQKYRHRSRSFWKSLIPGFIRHWWRRLRQARFERFGNADFCERKSSWLRRAYHGIISSDSIYLTQHVGDRIIAPQYYKIHSPDETRCSRDIGDHCFQLSVRRRFVSRLVHSDTSTWDALRFAIVSKRLFRLVGFNREYMPLLPPSPTRYLFPHRTSLDWVSEENDGTIRLKLSSQHLRNLKLDAFHVSYMNQTLFLKDNESKRAIILGIQQHQNRIGFTYNLTFQIMDQGHVVQRNISKLMVLEQLNAKLTNSPDYTTLEQGSLTLYFYQNRDMNMLNTALKDMSCVQVAHIHILSKPSPNPALLKTLLRHPKCAIQQKLDVLGIALMSRNWVDAYETMKGRMSNQGRIFAHFRNQIFVLQDLEKTNYKTDEEDTQTLSQWMSLIPFFQHTKEIARFCLRSDVCSRKYPENWEFPIEFIDIQDQFNETKLMKSVYNGDVETVAYLLEHGADPFLKSTDGMTALSFVHFILSVDGVNQHHGDAFVRIRNMLEQYSTLPTDEDEFDESALLHLSSSIGRTNVVSAIIQRGNVPIDDVDEYGETALLKAARKGNFELVERFITLYDLEDESTLESWQQPDIFGMNVFNWAWSFAWYYSRHSDQSNPSVKKQLFKYTRTKNALMRAAPEVAENRVLLHNLEKILLESILRDRPDVTRLFLVDNPLVHANYEDKDGNTPILAAFRKEKVSFIPYIFPRSEVRVYEYNKEGYTPFMVAANSSVSVVLQVTYFLKFINNSKQKLVNRIINSIHPETGKNALMVAAEYDHFNSLQIILKSGLSFNLTTTDRAGNSMLMNAILKQGSDELIKFLFGLENLSRIHNSENVTAFSILLQKNKCDLATTIFKSFDIGNQTYFAGHQDNHGRSLLMDSISLKCDDMAWHLMKPHFNNLRTVLLQKDSSGKTPLLIAIENRNEIFKAIVTASGQLGIKYEVLHAQDDFGKGILQYANSVDFSYLEHELYSSENEPQPAQAEPAPTGDQSSEPSTPSTPSAPAQSSSRCFYIVSAVGCGFLTAGFASLAVVDLFISGGIFTGVTVAIASSCAASVTGAGTAYCSYKAHKAKVGANSSSS